MDRMFSSVVGTALAVYGNSKGCPGRSRVTQKVVLLSPANVDVEADGGPASQRAGSSTTVDLRQQVPRRPDQIVSRRERETVVAPRANEGPPIAWFQQLAPSSGK